MLSNCTYVHNAEYHVIIGHDYVHVINYSTNNVTLSQLMHVQQIL